MKTTDLDNFNLTTQQVAPGIVKVGLTELEAGLTSGAQRAQQLIIRHFDSYGTGDSTKAAQETAIRRALSRKKKLGEGKFRVDITDLKQVSVELEDGDTQDEYLVTLGVGKFADIPEEFKGKGDAPIVRRVEVVGQSVSLEKAEDLAFRSALKKLGLK